MKEDEQKCKKHLNIAILISVIAGGISGCSLGSQFGWDGVVIGLLAGITLGVVPAYMGLLFWNLLNSFDKLNKAQNEKLTDEIKHRQVYRAELEPISRFIRMTLSLGLLALIIFLSINYFVPIAKAQSTYAEVGSEEVIETKIKEQGKEVHTETVIKQTAPKESAGTIFVFCLLVAFYCGVPAAAGFMLLRKQLADE